MPFSRTIRENWRLALVLVLALGSAGAGMFMAFNGGAGTAKAAQTAPLLPNKVIDEDRMREVIFAPGTDPTPSSIEQKKRVVDKHRARYEENPDAPDAEALLRAMGNLYKQTTDYENAAWAYGQYLRRFPQSLSKSAVYMELASCYELLDEKDNLTRLYLDMLDVFPPDSADYAFASASLHPNKSKFEQRRPNVPPPPGPEGTFVVEALPDGSTRYVESAAMPVAESSATVETPGS
jgi:hypothetical protein